MNKCPNKSSKEYKLLKKYFKTDEAVFAIYMANNSELPEVPTMTNIKKELAFATYASELKTALVLKRVGEYNERHNTRHRVVSKPFNVTTNELVLHLNYLPKNITKQHHIQY